MGSLKKVAGVGLVSVGVFSGAAFAQSGSSIDVSSIVATLTAVGVAAATLGLAGLAVHYGIKAYKMIRGAA